MFQPLARTFGLALLLPATGWSAPASAASWLAGGKAGSLSPPMQIVLLLTALTLLPAALVSVTPFLRTIIVLHFLRQALGTADGALEPGAGRTGAFLEPADHLADDQPDLRTGLDSLG